MSCLLRLIVLDTVLEDVRRMRACLQSYAGARVSVQHLTEAGDVLGRLSRMRADVLLIDEDLPRVTGVETIRALRASGEDRPIIATSRADCGYLAADLVLAGADGYLSKDVLHDALVHRVLDRALAAARGRKASDQLRRSAVKQMIQQRGTEAVGLA